MIGSISTRVALAAAACVFAMACGAGGGDLARTCKTPGGKITRGPYEVQNDTSGNTEAALPAHPVTNFTQCASLGAGSTTQTVNASWSWTWPHQSDPDERIVRATPSIIYGFYPWNEWSTTPQLPRRVGEVQWLRVDAASVDQAVSDGSVGRVAVKVYLTEFDVKPAGEDALLVRGTISVFVNDYPPRAPGGTAVQLGGVDYDLFAYGSTLLYYRRPDLDTPVTALHLDLADFLADGVARGALEPAWWVASVSTGPIVYEGSGALALEDYQVVLGAGSLPVRRAISVTTEGSGTAWTEGTGGVGLTGHGVGVQPAAP
ncbi:MAG TPA: hypothetical protein VEB43_07495 [Anaeromyxobacter sp.]|nr:hypothetical protein [Anaeromyxobacter sp.]